MTISNQESFVVAEGNGVTTQFSYSFLIPNASDVVVTITDISVSPPVASVLLNTQYTITGLGSSAGGLVTYPLAGAALAASRTITIARVLPIVQDVSISNQGNFYPTVVEGALDYLTMICQDIGGQVGVIEGEIADLTRADVSIVSSVTNAVTTIALLKSATVSAPLVGTMILVEGYYAANDGGGGLFYITNVNPGADNGGTIIHSNTSGFYYLRQINDGTVNPDMFGALTDGSNQTTALNACLACGYKRIYIPAKTYAFSGTLVIPTGVTVYGNGCGSASVLRPLATTGAATVNGNNVTIRDLTYSGSGSGFAIGTSQSTSGFKALNVEFNSFPANANSIENTVWLHTCNDVLVQGCRFYQVTYGVLQESGFDCSDIRVVNCIASDMYADFVNFNGATGHPANHILIDGNEFLGSHHYPTPETEERFLGCTSTNYVIVTNNFVQHCAGDAAIHLEDVGIYQTIANNVFLDCQVGGGNDGWVYILHSDAETMITGNRFLKTSNLAGNAYAVSTGSGSYTLDLTISNNYCFDVNGLSQFGLANLAFLNTGQGEGGKSALVSDNFVYGCLRFVTLKTTDNVMITDNRVRVCQDGVFNDCVTSASGTGGVRIHVQGNWIDCAGYCIRSGVNTNATGAPYGWIVTNNRFTSSFGAHSGVLIDTLGQGWATGNWYGSNLTNTTIASSPGANTTQKNDFKEGTGLIHP